MLLKIDSVVNGVPNAEATPFSVMIVVKLEREALWQLHVKAAAGDHTLTTTFGGKLWSE